MNHEYEDELGMDSERRSRRNPQQERAVWENRQRDAALRAERELDIMGDSTVHPLKKEVPKKPAPEPAPTPTRTAVSDGKGAAARVAAVAKAHGVSDKAAEAKAARAAKAEVNERVARATVEAKPVAEKKTSASKVAAATAAAAGAGGSEVRRRLEEEAAKRKKRRRIITMIIAECIALIFIFGYAYVARQFNKIQRPDNFKISELQTNELNVDTVETMKGYWTIAVFGVDSRGSAINKSTNADVNIICNVNRDTGEIKLVSVFRDTYLNLTEGGTYNKLNQAYFTGGPEQAIQVLNRNLDLQINDYMTFNWKAVADAINVLGGVDLELSDAEFYYINGFITETVEATGIGSRHLTHAGMNHLDGVQAVAYARLRLMDTDYARTERQRKVIAKAFEKAKQADFKTLNTLIGTVFPQVSTSIWVDDLVSNAKNISKFHLGDTMGFPQARGDANMGKKGAVVVPQTLESNVIKLHEFLFGDADYSPSQTVKNISAKIAADTGMYKEGQYVGHVSTEGVIQKPKATKPAATQSADEEDETETTKATTAAETDENGNPIESETDEDGNPITRPTAAVRPGMRPTAAETDENGDPIEPETDEDGNSIEEEETDENGDPVEPETDEDGNPVEEEETDEDGNPIESETDEDEEETSESATTQRPGSATSPTSPTSPTSSTRPTSSSGSSSVTRPGGNSGITSNVPGGTTGTGSGSTSGNGAVTRPGSATETTAANQITTRPGSTTETTAGNSATTKPGSTTGSSTTTKPGSTTGSSATTRPGSTTETSAGSSSSSGNYTGSAPGSSNTTSNNTVTAPGGSTTAPTAADAPPALSGVTGTVAAPGQ